MTGHGAGGARAGVPRVYSRVYDKVMQGLEEKGAVVQWLYGLAYSNQVWGQGLGFRVEGLGASTALPIAIRSAFMSLSFVLCAFPRGAHA